MLDKSLPKRISYLPDCTASNENKETLTFIAPTIRYSNNFLVSREKIGFQCNLLFFFNIYCSEFLVQTQTWVQEFHNCSHQPFEGGMSLLAREYEGVTRVRDFENWTVKKRKQRNNIAVIVCFQKVPYTYKSTHKCLSLFFFHFALRSCGFNSVVFVFNKFFTQTGHNYCCLFST